MPRSTVPIRTGEDVVRVRQEVRRFAIEAGLGLVDQTKIVTAASELARNTLDYGKGGAGDDGDRAERRPARRPDRVRGQRSRHRRTSSWR